MNLAIATVPAGTSRLVRGVYIAIGLFCLACIAAIWAFTLAQIRYEHEQTIEQEFTENANIALGFEELTSRVIKNAEQTLRLIAREHKQLDARLDIQQLIDGGLIDATTLNLVGVIDAHGTLLTSAPRFKPVNVADREYFQFHRLHASAELHIGKPVSSRVSGNWIVPLSLRIDKPDGSFGGIAYASLNAGYFNRLFEQADLGAQGMAMLVGIDGFSRVRRVGNVNVSGNVDMHGSTLFEKQRVSPVGSYSSVGKLEGVPRFVSYRTLAHYPLIAAIGTSQAETLAPLRSRVRTYNAISALASALLVLFAGGLIVALEKQKTGNKAIYASNERFGVAFNQAAVGIAMTRLDGRLLDVNARFCAMLGYDTAELLARSYLDITHPDDRKISEDNATHLLLEPRGTPPLLEIRYLRKDGGTLWTLVAVSVIRDSSGQPEKFMAVIEDVTERKRAELVLADNERRFRTLIESSLDIIIVTNGLGVITFVSSSVTRSLGYATTEVQGRNFLEFAHPDDVAPLRAVFAEVVAHPHQPIGATRRYRSKAGEWIVLESIATNLLDDPMIGGIVVNARDITVRALEQAALQKVNRALKTLSACNNTLVRAANETTLVQKMCDNIVELGGYALTWVGVIEHNIGKTVRPVAYAGYEQGFMEQAEITYADNEHGRGPVGTAIRKREVQVIQDALRDPSFRPWQKNAVTLGYGSLVALPLVSFDEVFGVLTIYAREANAFYDEELSLLEELAGDLAFGLLTLRTRVAQDTSEKRLLRSMEGTILAMAATLEMRDAYTAGHQRRVAELAAAIAREMGMPDEAVHGLHLAAVIHDLGKIQIPAEILSKPTRLSPIEYELIKTHPGAGYNILKGIEFPWPIAQMVYQHHERIDGTGYPRGLKGADILIGARILGVADTVEAMSSHRPYRAGLGIDKALEEILKNRDTMYDSDVVDVCVKLFREKQFAFAG